MQRATHHLKFWFLTIFMVGFCTLSVAATPAQAANQLEQQARSTVENLKSDALELINNKSYSDETRRTKFHALIEKGFDLDTIGKFALGTYWRSATKAQQKEYLKLFDDMILDTYANRINSFSVQDIKITDVKSKNNKYAIVRTEIQSNGDQPFIIDWRLKKEGKSLKIIDIVVEGISMVVTQRSEFGSVISQNGGDVEALLDALRTKSDTLVNVPELKRDKNFN